MRRSATITSDQPDREQLHRIVEGLSDGVVLIEPDGCIVWANGAALAMHGCAELSELGDTVKAYQQRFDLRLRDGQPLPATAYPMARLCRGEAFEDVVVDVRHKRQAEPDWVHRAHLLIAGSTGSGKSVMLNAMIMSFLYKATPDEVRMIMVDPKRVELGIYEGIPHLLTPVITEPKKATNALRNAVLEMERRLKLLAAQGVRNIDQYNRKMGQLRKEPLNLFEENAPEDEETQPLPYVLILIDELADLMMLERANVEECITRLAQMARAVGMHLVLATQRPSVDVITGLIKANFPSRISFRVATRVDSRTVLDSMGAEHLLGRGDMMFLPPGSSRLTRVHGAYVTELETNSVVDFWKAQAEPEYDESFLMTPPSEEEGEDGEAFNGEQDPMYEDAVRVVLEMGKASTSTLQRRLRLGYGRAARILDMMQREGIIGPPDGSKPREVLKSPDWLREVDNQLR